MFQQRDRVIEFVSETVPVNCMLTTESCGVCCNKSARLMNELEAKVAAPLSSRDRVHAH